MMQDIFFGALNGSMIILFIYVIFSWEGMIFFRAGLWLSQKLGPIICKVLFSCPTCMSIWYGGAFVLLTGYKHLGAVVVMAGITTVLTSIIDYLHLMKEFNED